MFVLWKLAFNGRHGLCLVCLFCKVNYAAAILLGYANCQGAVTFSLIPSNLIHKREKHLIS